MEDSTEALLVILVTILSLLTIVALVVTITVAVLVSKILKNAQKITDSTSETVSLIRNRLIKRAGLLATARYALKALRSKKN